MEAGGIQQIMRFIPDVSQVKKALSGIQAQVKNISTSMNLNVNTSGLNAVKSKILETKAAAQNQVLENKSLLLQAQANVQKEKANLLTTRQELLQNKVTKAVERQAMTFDKMFTKASYFWVKAVVMYSAIQSIFRPIMTAERGETVISNILPLYGIEDLQQRAVLAKKYMKDLLDYGAKIGVDITRVSEPYSQFMASPIQGLNLEQQDAIAKSFLKLGAALQIDSTRVEGMFLAISQMASKGKLSMEELRKQLSQHLPGSFSMAAKAMKITTAELEQRVRAGSITVTELLTNMSSEIERRYANFKKPDTLVQAVTDLKNAFSQLILAMRNGGFIDALTMVIKLVTGLLNILKGFAPLLSLIAALSLVAFSFLAINKFTHGLMSGLVVMKNMTRELFKIKMLNTSIATGSPLLTQLGMGIVPNTASKLAFLKSPALIAGAGLGLYYAGQKISDMNNPSENSTARNGGALMRILGQGEMWGQTGAVLGSVIPVLGTTAGAIAGTVIGIGTQIVQELKANGDYQKNKDALNQNKEQRIRMDMNINNKNNSDIDFSRAFVAGGMVDFNISGYTGDQSR
jgi:tape measure domain-containing protein